MIKVRMARAKRLLLSLRYRRLAAAPSLGRVGMRSHRRPRSEQPSSPQKSSRRFLSDRESLTGVSRRSFSE